MVQSKTEQAEADCDHLRGEDYDPAFVESILRASKLPPEATFKNGDEMLKWLNLAPPVG